MNIRVKNLLVILLLAFSGYLYGEPEYRIPSALNDGERGAYIPSTNYDILGVSIESATLETIKSTLGDASIYKGHHMDEHICYISGPYSVDFTISSLGFGYEVAPVDTTSAKCGTTTEPVVNGMGLEIGMSQADVIFALGEPSQTQDDSVSYTYWVQELPSERAQDALRAAHDIPSNESLWLDVYSNIRVSFESGRVSQFSVNTTKTY